MVSTALVVLIGPTLVRLPPRFTEGTVIDADDAERLQVLWENNVFERLRQFIKASPRTTAEGLQAEADRLAETYALPPPRRDAGDPIEVEARNLARESLLSRLRAEGLPAPRNLDDHITILLDRHPRLYDTALERVEARLRTDRDALARLGLGAAAQ